MIPTNKLVKFFKNRISIAIILLCTIILPQTAYGAILDESAAAAANLLPYILSIMQYLMGILTKMIENVVYLAISAVLLDIAINKSILWIDINSDFAQAGLGLTTALADIFLILVFIFIALAYVFKVESFQAQKSLPKFFIVALLIHFAPLFVGMVTDIGNILTKGIMENNESLFTGIFVSELAADALAWQIVPLAATFLVAAGASLAGTIGIAANYITYGLAIGNLFLGVPKYIVTNVILSTTAAILFAHAVFFLTRVFMIQLLTVLSPLAILCYAIPQTKKYFDMWKEWLLGWTFGGILFLFLLVLGLTSLNALINLPEDPYINLSTGEWMINLAMGTSFKWIALAVYMIAVDAICMAMIPALAKTFTEKAKTGGNPMQKIEKSISKSAMAQGESHMQREFDQGIARDKGAQFNRIMGPP